jgi:ATP-binding cassette, subfamily B, bacterial PglK
MVTDSNITKLWNHLSKHRQKHYWYTLILVFIASIAEVISIGAVIPFLAVLTAPETLFQYPYISQFIQVFGLTEPQQILLPITVIFILSAVLAGLARVLLLYAMTRLTYATGADLSIDIYRRTLYQDYPVHISRNSSEIINGVITKINTIIAGIISPTLTLISSVVFVVVILIALFAIDIIVALTASIAFGGFYLGIIYYTRHRLRENSQCVAEQSTQMVKSLQEGLGGIRDVIINSSQEFYCDLYRRADLPVRRATANSKFISASPRFVMEALGMTIIAGLAYMMSQREGGLDSAIPILGALALGAQRLLPALQLGFSSYSNIKASWASLNDVLMLLDQPISEYVKRSSTPPISFKKKIELSNISFRHTTKSPWILKNINLIISKGSRVGFIGVTGSGKSTLLDIVMGLLQSIEGKLIVDNCVITSENRGAWQKNIAHVPQNIYLSDSTIEENIAFGLPKEEINHKQVVKVAKQAQIEEFIKKMPNQYQTTVGEGGVQLSGGQRQRIGIARALYKEANVLIFDEATSALDNETELAIMKAIDDLGKDFTILIIAHRLSTLTGCDQVVEVSNYGVSVK